MGNVPSARAANDPDKSWHEAGVVTTRLQSRAADQMAPLCKSPVKQWLTVNKEEIVRLQEEDQSMRKYRGVHDVIGKGQQEANFEVKDQVVYRIYQLPKVNVGRAVRQVMYRSLCVVKL